MINYDRVAGKIFAIIKGHGFNLSMFTEDGMDTSEPGDGRRFYVKEPNFMITLDEDNDEIKINKNSNVTLEEIEGILKQMKNLAKQNLLNTQVKVFGKEIAPKDFAYQAKKYRNKDMSGISEASLSRMTGSKKTSYQTLESVKMIVRHKKAVDEDVRGSRSRQIQAIFLEQAGERFRFPHNNLAGARAMARHMYEGGNMQDQLGEYIIESVGNLQKLVEFVRYTRTNKLINETSEDIIKTIKENISTIRKEFKGLTGAKSYHAMSEAIAAREEQVLEEDDTIDLQDIFTVRKFDEKIGDMLPLVRKLMNEKAAWRKALIEASKQTILMHEKEELAEEDIMEFENSVQQVGYKIGKVAKRMVETGDLSKFVSKVAGKLIEGETISDFEKTIVRNVLENAIIEESTKCEKCGCYDCTCDINKRDTVESISDAFDLKMKMIEHEDIFVEEYDIGECPDCDGEGVFVDDTKCLSCDGSGRTDREGVQEEAVYKDCPTCKGTGKARTKKVPPRLKDTGDCPTCKGEGNTKVNEGDYKDCPDCNGGYTQDGKDCKRCEGNGKLYESRFEADTEQLKRILSTFKKYNKRGWKPNRIDSMIVNTNQNLTNYALSQAYKKLGILQDPSLITHKRADKYAAKKGFNEDDWDDEVRRGESEAGAGMGMPMPDYADCERCEGTGSESAAGNPLGRFGDDDKCTLCGGSGQADYVRGSKQDPFGGNYGVDVEDYMVGGSVEGEIRR